MVNECRNCGSERMVCEVCDLCSQCHEHVITSRPPGLLTPYGEQKQKEEKSHKCDNLSGSDPAAKREGG